MTTPIDADYEAMRSKRTLYHHEGRTFDAVDTLCAMRTCIMNDSGATFEAVTAAVSAALTGDGTTPERFKTLVREIGEHEAWKRVYVAAWAAVDPRVEAGNGS